jgi:hypothetical protein
MKRRDAWKEFRARVAELERSGMATDAARAQAGGERVAAKAKRREELAAEKQARSLRALHCQICARDILADTGHIAHHGYERPGDGWQTQSCHGALKLPFEVSRDALGVYCESLLRSAEQHRAHTIKLQAESVAPCIYWHEYNRALCRSVERSANVTRATFESVMAGLPAETKRHSPAWTFDSVLLCDLARSAAREKFFREEYRRQKARYDGWRPTHKWDSDLRAWCVVAK